MPIVPIDRVETPDGYPAEDRAIFAYGLIGRDWRGDPLAIEVRYDRAMADLNPEAIEANLGRKDPNARLRGQRRALPPIRATFGLPAFAEGRPGGLSDREAFALLDRFIAYRDRIRAAYRREAELLATFGPLPGRGRSYEREAGLWWNRERARGIRAVAHWYGALAAGTLAELPFCLPDALAATEEQARVLHQVLNDDRRQAEARGRSDRAGAP